MTLLLLLLACAPLVGTWEGDAECSGYNFPLTVELDAFGDHYEGWGSLDCSSAYGSDCFETFDIDAELESGGHDRDIEVDLDNCALRTWGETEFVSCDDPTGLEWSPGDGIRGDWSGCDVELERG